MPRASKRSRSELVDAINDALEIVDDVAQDGDGDLLRAVIAGFALKEILEGNYEDDRADEDEDGPPEEDEEEDGEDEEPEADAEDEPEEEPEEEPEPPKRSSAGSGSKSGGSGKSRGGRSSRAKK